MADDVKRVEALAGEFRAKFRAITGEVRKVIVGYSSIIDEVVAGLVVGGNVLVEGVPGLGKTMMLLALAKSCDLRFRRVQFTPDLMPADITGTNTITQTESGARAVEFSPGPIFTNIMLADEINRATPRTQSALLEAMEEHAVSAGGETRRLDEPFFVMATQNPIEQEGTYPLPEAALDKFLFKLIVEMPGAAELKEILARTTSSAAPEARTVSGAADILRMRDIAFQVPVAPPVEEFAMRLVRLTREPHEFIKSGASPRALKALLFAGRVRALLEERYNTSSDDIAALAKPVLRHRITLSYEADAENVQADAVIDELLTRMKR